MNQQRIGGFLKQLRKGKGLTQEQLAEHFYVSSRTVSRWETGSNMPDVEMLIDIAEFYDVDIREIIDGERKSENMDSENKDTLKKVAKYTEEVNNNRKERLRTMLAGSTCLMLLSYLLLEVNTKDTSMVLFQKQFATGLCLLFAVLLLQPWAYMPYTVWGLLIKLVNGKRIAMKSQTNKSSF